MLTTLCWPGSFSYDPIADPQNVSAETCVSDHLKPYIDDGINQIKDPFVSMGDEVGCGGTPNNKTSLAIYFKQWAEERRGLTLADLGCSDHVASPTNWSGCFNDSASIVSPGAASRRYFYSQLFSHDYGIETYATITAIAREYVLLHTF